MPRIKRSKPLSPECLLFAGFLLLVLIQECFILQYQSGSPAAFFFPDLLLFLLLAIKYKPAYRLLFTGKKWLFFLFVPALCFLFFQTLFAAAEAKNPGLLKVKQKSAAHDRSWHPAANPGADKEQQAAPDAQSGFVERHWPALQGEKHWNFVCLQVESLQCGLEYVQHNGQYVMPYLNSLTRTALYYPYCFSFHHSVGGTSDCEFSVLNNAEPVDDACMVTREYEHSNSVVKVLNRYNYQATAFHNYYKSFFDRYSAFPRIGFARYYDVFDMKITGPIWVNEDRQMFEFIINNRSRWKPPFLHYILTLSSHKGFSHVNRFYKAPFLADIGNKRDRDAYACFSYVDVQLEKFVAAVRQLYPDTWIFIYGDHSLSTVKFAGYLERSTFTLGGDFLEFVTLFILAPDNRHADFSGTLASFHDIGPTIVSLLPGAQGSTNAYPAYGGSLLYDPVEALQIPFNGTMYDRRMLLHLIKAKMEPYRQHWKPGSSFL